ncbi:flagellar protein FlaG [Cytobacillus eiseniae]|uniref:Flagellar protein FlaG n=1 Tax=Cytobacillus eiseniae TaxID=762947 RepID=A0ABS4RGI1_9BACI|nr:flagellar protein FlaG [Cytobacillus eiseniae]MBP2241996.1 flagellar protein FlaG [Cytobacillus eiseniae]
MLESLSTNVLSSQLRTTTSEGISSYYQGKIDKIAYSEQQNIEEGYKPKEKEVREIVDSMNTFLEPAQTSIRFEYHEKLNEYYVRIVNDTTEETVKEIPSKKLLDFYAAMTEFVGLMVDEKI